MTSTGPGTASTSSTPGSGTIASRNVAAAARAATDASATSPYARGAVGLLLMSAAAFGLVQIAFLGVPSAVLPWGVALKLLLGGMGLRLAMTPHHEPTAGAHLWTHATIGAVLVVLPVLMSWNPSRSSWAIALVLPILWGLHFRLPGALVGTTVAALTIVATALVGDAVWGYPFAPWAAVWQTGLATALGMLCGVWAHSSEVLHTAARRERAAVEAVAARERELAARLAEMDQMRSAFVAATSHELRTPLTTISGFAATLRRPDLHADADDVEQMLGGIERAAGRLNRLVEDLRTAAMPETTTPEVDAHPVAVVSVVDDVVTTVGAGRTSALGDRDVRVLADPERLYQVLANLVTNALRHGADNVVLHWGGSGGQVQLAVTDDGPGIPPDHRDRVFERFFRGEDANEDGHGLGLAISRDLCERMGGSLELAETDGEGASFVVTLPAARAGTTTEPVPVEATA